MSSKIKNNGKQNSQERYAFLISDSIRLFELSLMNWPNHEADDSETYALLSILKTYTKIKTLMTIIKKSSDTPQYKLEIIKQLYDNTISGFEEKFEDSELHLSIIQLFQKDSGLWERLEILDAMLEDIIKMADDINLYGEELVLEDLRQTAMSFIIRLTDIAWVVEKAPGFIEQINGFSKLKSRFSQIEKKVEENFHIFLRIEDILKNIRQDLDYSDFWWLTKLPENQKEIPEKDIEKEIEAFGKVFKKNVSSEQKCPSIDTLFAYASPKDDPTSFSDRPLIMEHLKTCKDCLRQILDLCFINDALEDSFEKPALPHEVWNKIIESITEKIPDERLQTTEIADAFNFSLGTLPDYIEYSKTSIHYQPEYCDTSSDSISITKGYLVWLDDSGIEIKRAVLDIKIGYKAYESDKLIISGQVEIYELKNLFSIIQTKCEWQTPEKRYHPEKLSFDPDTGYFTVTFHLPSDIPGHFAFWFLIGK